MVQENDLVVDFDVKARAFSPSKDGQEVFVELERGQVKDPLEWPSGTGERFLTALDLETGVVRWIAATPHGASPASGWLITKTRIFVSRHTQLDVFERATGKHFGYIGWR